MRNALFYLNSLIIFRVARFVPFRSVVYFACLCRGAEVKEREREQEQMKTFSTSFFSSINSLNYFEIYSWFWIYTELCAACPTIYASLQFVRSLLFLWKWMCVCVSASCESVMRARIACENKAVKRLPANALINGCQLFSKMRNSQIHFNYDYYDDDERVATGARERMEWGVSHHSRNMFRKVLHVNVTKKLFVFSSLFGS